MSGGSFDLAWWRSAAQTVVVRCLVLLWVSMHAFGAAWAQSSGVSTQVSPGVDAAAQASLVQQQRDQALRDEALRKALAPQPDVRLQAPGAMQASVRDLRLPESEQPCFEIDALRLQGELAHRFEWALAEADLLRQPDQLEPEPEPDPVRGRCLGAEGVNVVLSRVQNAIVERGFVTTRVLAPGQNLKSGVLTLVVVPGRVRQVRLAPGSSPRANIAAALPVRVGDVLNLRDIEQGLENLQRLPSVQADVQIVPSEGPAAEPGDSDLVVSWQQASPWRLSASVDDGGSRSTGRYLGGLTLSVDHALALNDLFYLSLNRDLGGGDDGARGTRGGTVHYSLPLGAWLLGMNASRNTYRQAVAGLNQTYLYRGISANADLRLARMVHRDAVNKLSVYAKAWVRASNNFIDDTELQVQRRRMGGWELGFEHQAVQSSWRWQANLAWRQGTGAFGALPAPEELFGEGTSRPQMLLLDVQWVRPFKVGDAALKYTATLRGQWAGTPLVPQDRFALGGRYSVRGFDGENTLAAERGWWWRNEWSLDLGSALPGHALYLGLDHGRLEGPSAQFLAGHSLTGAVIGLRGAVPALNAGYDLFWGAPLRKPKDFRTSDSTGGFTLNWSL